ncbi:hypothetical protein BH23VER1_BH23VER1_30910 [soil metagenome]
MIKRLILLNIVLGGGYAAVGLIPDAPPIQEASVEMDLPEAIGSWEGKRIEPSEAELQLLSEDTEFEKRLYSRSEPTTLFEQLQAVNAGIVLSGQDLNNSIHRPERCLPAQGFRDLQVTTVEVPVGESSVTVRRIHSYRDLPMRDGGQLRLYNINYYWFVGHGHSTESHYERTFLDMSDRLVKGYNQRWAYFTISSYMTDNIDPIVGRDEAATDKQIAKFIEAIYQSCVTL